MFGVENDAAGCPTTMYEKNIIVTVEFVVVEIGESRTIISSVVESEDLVISTNPPVHAANGSALNE